MSVLSVQSKQASDQVIRRVPATQKEVNAAVTALWKAGDFTGFDQEKMQLFMKTNGQGLISGFENKWIKPDKIEALEKAMVEKGLCGSSEYFDSIPSRLPTQIIDDKRIFPITRLVLHETGHDEQLLIQGSDNEQILLMKLGPLFGGSSTRWKIQKTYQMAMGDNESVTVGQPRLWSSYEEFIRISKITQGIIKIEAVVQETLLDGAGMPLSVTSIALEYLGYPSLAEKNSAKENRQKLLESIKGEPSPVEYYLPAKNKGVEEV